MYMSEINASSHTVIAFINNSMINEGFTGSIADCDAIVGYSVGRLFGVSLLRQRTWPKRLAT